MLRDGTTHARGLNGHLPEALRAVDWGVHGSASLAHTTALQALQEHDPDLWDHSVHVGLLCFGFGSYLDPPERPAEPRRYAWGLTHDIGKILIPGTTLNKRGPLDPAEQRTMRLHPLFGAAILSQFEGLGAAAVVARAHHERWDGQGYPDGLAGPEIPREARIATLCDVWSACRQPRPYRDGMSYPEARARIERGRGTEFDPALVDPFLCFIERSAAQDHAWRREG